MICPFPSDNDLLNGQGIDQGEYFQYPAFGFYFIAAGFITTYLKIFSTSLLGSEVPWVTGHKYLLQMINE